MIDKFTTHLKSVLIRSCTLARKLNSDSICPEHLLYAVATEHGSLGSKILARVKINAKDLSKFLNGAAENIEIEDTSRETSDADFQPKADSPLADKTAVPGFSPDCRRILEKAVLTAHLYNHQYVGTEHLLASLIHLDDTLIKNIFAPKSQTFKTLREHLALVLESATNFPNLLTKNEEKNYSQNSAVSTVKNNQKNVRQKQASKTPALDFFTSDLTKAAAAGRIDPLIGREKELERVTNILCRRNKNNPLLLGDPGVGKTALVEGLARRIALGEAPLVLQKKRVLALDIPLLVAGAVYRGEFEGRLKQILDEAKHDSNIILFIDEVHTINGAGAASGSLDAANILKPALSRGEIKCIGATTLAEYKKHLETDGAIERRFQPIIINEPSRQETLAILEGLKEKYEAHHGVRYSPEALEAATSLAERFLPEKFFPDKALDLIDEAAAGLQLHRAHDAPNLNPLLELEKNLEETKRAKHEAILSENFTLALQLKTKERELEAQIKALGEQMNAGGLKQAVDVTREDIVSVVSKITGVPESDLLATNNESTKEIADKLAQNVIGQKQAIDTVAAAVRRARSGLNPKNRPLASFLFMGPTGVGKTELAKAIASHIFRDVSALIRLDMSEFTESFQMSKLIGAPAGYVGFRDQSKLTDAVKRKPYSVVLFDEMEKAHPDILNILLQILDEGRLTDATGRVIDFKNTFVIMTSNIGGEHALKNSLGFSDGGGEQSKIELERAISRAAKDFFRPELLNRIDSLICFRSLSKEDIARIIDMRLEGFFARLKKEKRLKISATKTARELLAEKSFEPSEGARAVRKVLEREIENRLAEVIGGDADETKTFCFDARGKEIVLKNSRDDSMDKKRGLAVKLRQMA